MQYISLQTSISVNCSSSGTTRCSSAHFSRSRQPSTTLRRSVRSTRFTLQSSISFSLIYYTHSALIHWLPFGRFFFLPKRDVCEQQTGKKKIKRNRDRKKKKKKERLHHNLLSLSHALVTHRPNSLERILLLWQRCDGQLLRTQFQIERGMDTGLISLFIIFFSS